MFLVAGVLSYGVVQLWAHYGTPPGVPASAPLTPAILTAVVLATALAFRSRLKLQREAVERARNGVPDPPYLPGQHAPKPLDPLQAARAAMFAKASSAVGSIVAGVYGGYLVFLLANLDIDVYRSRAVVCGLAVAAGVALVAAALFLEYVLRIPPPSDPDVPTPKNGTKATNPARTVRSRPEGTYHADRT